MKKLQSKSVAALLGLSLLALPAVAWAAGVVGGCGCGCPFC